MIASSQRIVNMLLEGIYDSHSAKGLLVGRRRPASGGFIYSESSNTQRSQNALWVWETVPRLRSLILSPVIAHAHTLTHIYCKGERQLPSFHLDVFSPTRCA